MAAAAAFLSVPPPPATSVQRFTADGRPTPAQVTYEQQLRAYLAGLQSPQSFTVAALPAGSNGMLVFASNGRKAGEAAGSGTGVMVAFSNMAWRRISDDAVVVA